MKENAKNDDIVSRDEELFSSAGRIQYYPMAIKRGEGSYVWDHDGNKYLDFLASAAVNNVGHSHPEVVEAIGDQAEDLIHYTPAYMFQENLVDLVEKVHEITPGDYEKRTSFGQSGSDAVDGAIKFARAYTGKSKIISFLRSYHGSTYGSISLSGISANMVKKIGPTLPDVTHIPYPDCYRCPFDLDKDSCGIQCLDYVESLFDNILPPEEVAAIFIEPIQGDAGIIEPPEGYLKRLESICRENNILLVAEEVQMGMGRTGEWFSIQHWDVEPDITILGKAFASGMPLSAITGRKEIINSLDAPGHLFTTAANPVVTAAANKTIDVMREENLVQNSKEVGKYMKKRFLELKEDYEIIGDVRGIGLSLGVDLVKDRKTKERAVKEALKIGYRAWEKGLLMTPFSGNVLRIQPPLTLTKDQANEGIKIIEESIQDLNNDKIPDKVLKELDGW